MNCITCGKKIVAGYALCGDCGKNLGNGIAQTRLGRFVQHPEELAATISTVDAPWCKSLSECAERFDAEDYDEQEQDAKCTACALAWLMETV